MDDLLTIEVGRVPNDGTGDALRTASRKANAKCGAPRSGLEAARTAAAALAGRRDTYGHASDVVGNASGRDSPTGIPGMPSAQTAFNAVLGDLFRGWALTLPARPSDGSGPAVGWYRNGDAIGYSLTCIS